MKAGYGKKILIFIFSFDNLFDFKYYFDKKKKNWKKSHLIYIYIMKFLIILNDFIA